MRLLIMGAPGAGKGTQAEGLAERCGVPAISTGDIFRENIRNATPLGVQVKQLIDSGEYVPDEVTEEIVADRLAKADCEPGFLLDGFPRTMHQVTFLDEYLDRQGTSLDAVVSLKVDAAALVERLLKRAEIEGRADDDEDTVRRRMQVYTEQTAPLLSHYQRSGLLVEVDGTGTLDEVRERISKALDNHISQR